MLLRRLNSKFTHGSLKGRKQLLLNTNIATAVAGSSNVGRPYFTFMDRVKEAVRVPVKHVESFFEPKGYDYESQLPNTEHLYGNSAMVFNAYLTHNAIDMNTWHDMDNTYHNQFGTVDNPVLVFTTDSSWRIVICMGPGVEDESHSHEKMFYFLREGPMNRCHLCGQCFKLVRLKDEYSEVNDYYSFMFSSLSHFDISEEDANIPMHQLFGNRPMPNNQSKAATNVYVHVNPDQADHMLVDPAYKLQKLEEAYERLEALMRTYRRIDEESQVYVQLPIATSRTLYSNWFEIEKSIRKLDRWFLKVEKFNARQFIDSDNHERRERRMIERKRDRWADNYTYFFGGLSEEEQMYRDYFQTDLERDPEDEVNDELMDELDISSQGEFRFDKYDFIETNMDMESHESLIDIVDRKIFKYKYRMNNDDLQTYLRRMDRVVKRQLDRAKKRDPAVEINLAEMVERTDRESRFGQHIYGMTNKVEIGDPAHDETSAIRDYMFEESVQQYKDYFESDDEDQGFFEYMEELPFRDRIKFIEIFEDYTIPKKDGKGYVKIPKREYNPELSYFSNVALDLIDFRDRVFPLAKDAARLDSSFRYQRMSADETYENIREGRKKFNQFLEAQGAKPFNFQDDKDLLSSEELFSTEESQSSRVNDNNHWETQERIVKGEASGVDSEPVTARKAQGEIFDESSERYTEEHTEEHVDDETDAHTKKVDKSKGQSE
jgi:hypothetical protein